MASENVPVAESLDVTQTPAAEVATEVVVPLSPETEAPGIEMGHAVRLRAGDPAYDAALKARDERLAERAREQALSGITGPGQPTSGSGQ